jgi:hypothetical protein
MPADSGQRTALVERELLLDLPTNFRARLSMAGTRRQRVSWAIFS